MYRCQRLRRHVRDQTTLCRVSCCRVTFCRVRLCRAGLPSHITLSTIKESHPHKPPQVTVYPLLHDYLQNLTNYGTVFCKQPVTGESIKIYPGLTHVLKAQSKNFLTLPLGIQVIEPPWARRYSLAPPPIPA